ncbi:gypsy retrotransposon integrase-like protein 1 [Plakobranchus ocellatus]|uniref:Gypsy retrotransposon integrase-like protein 1 n=1 Tax=Plakobranchus ocellatus TaxID=259542 RepID=A0AAV4D7U9_9GAST|nr:gypsy retrotransposon integrase-like protein 1 [Plakobranchus ocellatus]
MADVEKLIKAGGSLGMLGQALNDWVTKQLADQEKQRQDDLERLRMEREKIYEQQQLVEKELELKRLIIEHQESTPPSSPNYSADTTNPAGRLPLAKSPRLPCFDDKTDQIDSYLLRFERYATVNGWARKDWAIHLAALLKGKALEVYTRLDEEDAQKYDKCRDALLKRYNLTQDGFQEKFRRSRPEAGESISQFKTRIQSYLDKWQHLAGKDKSNPDDLIDFVIMEQLMNICSKDLVVFLKERKPKSADDLIGLAEKYVEAHGETRALSRISTEKKADERSSLPPQLHTGAAKQPIQCRRCKRFGRIEKFCNTKILSVIKEVHCSFCGRRNHSERECWKKQRQIRELDAQKVDVGGSKNDNIPAMGACPCKGTIITAACTGHVQMSSRMPTAVGYVDGKRVNVLRDSGCSCVVIRHGLAKKSPDGKKKISINLADGTLLHAPVTDAKLECPFYTGKVDVVEMKSPLYDVILGNIPGAKCPGIAQQYETMAVETRNKKGHNMKSLLTPTAVDTGITVDTIREKQKDDVSLEDCRKRAETGEIKHTGRHNKSWYGYERRILFRYFQSPVANHGDVSRQVVVPKELRMTVMKLAHESILSGHLAAKKTTERVLQDFHWPKIWDDISRFCRSCDQCQRSAPKGHTSKVPLSAVPLIDEPFSRIAVDLVGPILPASENGNRYILTVVDYCTRYPEAVPLKSIDTETVAEALVDIFSRTGIPKKMLTDRGTQFTSELMEEICRLLSVKRLTTSPYHPQCNGLVERFNATLKGMLKRLASDRPKDWDRYIIAALFAYREAPQESLGFSPFELLYARPVRGPMTILRELWTEDITDEEVKTTYQYVIDLREKMEKVIEVAHDNLKKIVAVRGRKTAWGW